MSPVERTAHTDSGWRCLVAHYENGELLPACVRCSDCGGHIRPENMDAGCPGSFDWMYCANCGGSTKMTKMDTMESTCTNCDEPWVPGGPLPEGEF